MKFQHCDPAVLFDAVGGDKAMFAMMTEIFFREIGRKFSLLKFAAEAGDLEALGNHSHSLKGTVGPVAPRQLLHMLQQLEDECERQRCLCDAARVARLRGELTAVAAEVRQFSAQL